MSWSLQKVSIDRKAEKQFSTGGGHGMESRFSMFVKRMVYCMYVAVFLSPNSWHVRSAGLGSSHTMLVYLLGVAD